MKEAEIENSEFRSEMILSTVQGTLNRKLTLDDRKGLEEVKKYLMESIE